MTNTSTRTVGRVVGGLFLSAFFFYGGGSFLIDSATDGALALPEQAASLRQLSTGAALLLANSVAVAVIGVLVFRVLRRRARGTARAYLSTRAIEAMLLALAPISTLVLVVRARRGAEDSEGWSSLARSAVENGQSTYWVAMTVLGVGSVLFCRTLLTSDLLPKRLALLGIFGYSAFALGSALQLAGLEVGLVMSAPGGLFEVVAGTYLLVKGFGPSSTVRAEASDTRERITTRPAAALSSTHA